MDKFEESVQLSIVPESNSSGNDPSAPLASWDFIDINMVKKEVEEMEVEVDSPIFPAVERSFNDFDLVNKESMLLENELKEEIVIKEETVTSEISRTSPPKLDSSTNYDAMLGANSESEDGHDDNPMVLEVDKPSFAKRQPPQENRGRKRKRNLVWKNITSNPESINFPNTQYEEQDHTSLNEGVFSPISYVRKFLTKDILELIVEQSNHYSTQKDPEKPLGLDILELEQWLGLCFYFSISMHSDTRLHWKKGISHEKITRVMSRDRWEDIKKCFHLTDKNIMINTNDKVAKVKPLVNHLRDKFKMIPMTEHLSIDEQIIPFKGKSSLKQSHQYIPKEPHKWGHKFFVLCDSKGMVYDFFPYVAKIDPVEDPDVPDLGPSSNLVLHLSQCIPRNQNYKLYLNNWFTSLPLIQYLSTQGIWCCGTVQAGRLPGLNFMSDKDLEKKERGSMDAWQVDYETTQILALKWMDTRSVCLLSSFLSADPLDTCERFDKKTKSRVKIPCPNIVKEYNTKMGGVDLHGQMIALYRMSFRCQKYYQKLIFHLLDMSVVNSWFLYRRDAEKAGITKKKQMSLSEFKITAAYSLMEGGKNVVERVCRPSNSVESAFEKKKVVGRATQSIPCKDVRLDGIGHYPGISEKRLMCKNPGCSRKVNHYCMKCDIHMCCDRAKNCFYIFHTQ